MNNDYSLCDQNNCPFVYENHFVTTYECKEYTPIMKEYPKEIKFGYDKECNIACEMCRDNIYTHSNDFNEQLDSKIETIFLPALKNAEIVAINAAGDPFASKHSRKLIKEIVAKYPNIKYEFHTNGSLCTPKILKDLNVEDKIAIMRISLHASTPETYGKIVDHGDKIFPKTLENLNYIKEIRKNYQHPFEFYLQFVIMAKNYKEMPQFVDFAYELDAIPVFWEYSDQLSCSKNKQSEAKSVHLENHPDHKDFMKYLNHPNMSGDGCYVGLSPLLLKLREG